MFEALKGNRRSKGAQSPSMLGMFAVFIGGIAISVLAGFHGALQILAFSAGLVLLGKAIAPKILKGIPLNVGAAALVGLVLVVPALLFSESPMVNSSLSQMGLAPAEIVSGQTYNPPSNTIPTSGLSLSDQCRASVSDNIRGTSATINLDTFNREANTKTNIGTTGVYILDSVSKKPIESNLAASTSTKVFVSELVDIYPLTGNSTYYGDPQYNVCINSQQLALELSGHAAATTSQMQITGYDNTGSNTLTAGTTNNDDYTLTIGASATDTFYTKLKTNAANVIYNLGAVTVITNNQTKAVSLVGSDKNGYTYTTGYIPLFLQGPMNISYNTTNVFASHSGVSRLYTVSPTMNLKAWDTVKMQWQVDTKAVDPVAWTDTTGVATDLSNGKTYSAISFINNQWAVDKNGIPQYDYYQHDTNEASVGVNANTANPLGKTTGVVIAFI